MRELKFSKEPARPLKDSGELWHAGWDIPTVWAVDAAGQAWMDNGHGHSMEPVRAEALLGNADDEHQRNRIRAALGMLPEPPEWEQRARRAGWTTPDENRALRALVRRALDRNGGNICQQCGLPVVPAFKHDQPPPEPDYHPWWKNSCRCAPGRSWVADAIRAGLHEDEEEGDQR